ncbi:MAG: histidine phosphatase family protein [Desulfarculaceae bacterium]|nr:histidine phosphatase family protein [Desulfarculaceae bacterium]
MAPKYEINSRQTLEMLNKLSSDPVDGLCVLMRHSERNYHENAAMEPFMGLTENGKNAAVDLGAALPASIEPAIFSSHFGRCIETAYLIDKGFTRQGGRFGSLPVISSDLSPFYIRHIKKAIRMVEDMTPDRFLRAWFNREIPETVMEDPRQAALRITSFLKDHLDHRENSRQSFSICITHDWNIFPVREYIMDLSHEKNGPIGYLDAIFLFRKEGRYFMASRQKEPVEVTRLLREKND